MERIEAKYGTNKIEALKIYLKTFAENDNDGQMLIGDFAKMLDMDSEKLLHTTEYQKDVLHKIQTIRTIQKKPKEIDR